MDVAKGKGQILMKAWVIRTKETKDYDDGVLGGSGGHVIFAKDKMGRNTGVLYLTESAANRAMAQIAPYYAKYYEIVEVAIEYAE